MCPLFYFLASRHFKCFWIEIYWPGYLEHKPLLICFFHSAMLLDQSTAPIAVLVDPFRSVQRDFVLPLLPSAAAPPNAPAPPLRLPAIHAQLPPLPGASAVLVAPPHVRAPAPRVNAAFLASFEGVPLLYAFSHSVSLTATSILTINLALTYFYQL